MKNAIWWKTNEITRFLTGFDLETNGIVFSVYWTIEKSWAWEYVPETWEIYGYDSPEDAKKDAMNFFSSKKCFYDCL